VSAPFLQFENARCSFLCSAEKRCTDGFSISVTPDGGGEVCRPFFVMLNLKSHVPEFTPFFTSLAWSQVTFERLFILLQYYTVTPSYEFVNSSHGFIETM